MHDVVQAMALAHHRFYAGVGLRAFATRDVREAVPSVAPVVRQETPPAVPILPTCWACHRAVTKAQQRRREFVTVVENGQTIWRHVACPDR